MITYGFKKEISLPFHKAEAVVTDELKKKGFGILTRIDVKEKFKEKLGIDFPNYIILGACNPPYAHKAIQAEEDIGLLLPCNVIVYEKEGKAILAIMKPSAGMEMVRNDTLNQIATEVEAILKEVFDSMQ